MKETPPPKNTKTHFCRINIHLTLTWGGSRCVDAELQMWPVEGDTDTYVNLKQTTEYSVAGFYQMKEFMSYAESKFSKAHRIMKGNVCA